VVQEPVEEADGGSVFGEESAPFFEWPVAGDGEAAAFVGGGDELEQQLAAGGVQGAKPTSSQMIRSLRRTVSVSRPTLLSAMPR